MKLCFYSGISKFNVVMTIGAFGVTTFSLPRTAVPQPVCVETSAGNVVCGEPVPKSSSNPVQTDRNTAPVAQPRTSQSREIWTCRASSKERIYVVDQLNRDANSFDMAIYKNSRGEEGEYIGTVQVNITQKEPELVGRGQFGNSPIEVSAFGRTPAFYVQDSSDSHASGICSAFWEMADSETRRLVRECLALAARKHGFVTGIDGRACPANPRSYIQELQRQQ